MIIGLEKIEKCDQRIKDLVQFLYETFHNVVITSGFREGDPRQHGKGLAVDIVIPDKMSFEIATAGYGKFKDTLRGIGENVYKNFVHFDFGDFNYLRRWTYDKQGNDIK